MIFNQLKLSKIIPTLSLAAETALVIFLVSAFLGFAERQAAKRAQRLHQKELTESSEVNSMMRRVLY